MEEEATWGSSSSSTTPSSPSSEHIDESPNETLISSPLPRSQPSSTHIIPTTVPLMELDSPFQASGISTPLGERSESPIQRTQVNRWHPQNPIAMLASSMPFGSTEEQFQELLNQAGGSISLYPNGVIPYQLHHPIIPNHQINDWISQGHQGVNDHSAGLNGSLSRYRGNAIYDPMYETIGLPVDPHLRMFAARRNGGVI